MMIIFSISLLQLDIRNVLHEKNNINPIPLKIHRNKFYELNFSSVFIGENEIKSYNEFSHIFVENRFFIMKLIKIIGLKILYILVLVFINVNFILKKNLIKFFKKIDFLMLIGILAQIFLTMTNDYFECLLFIPIQTFIIMYYIKIFKNLFDYLKLINQFKSIIIDLVISFTCFIGINSLILITFLEYSSETEGKN